jgi:uncharacterized NAD-dependent epimerase/dehydratase family protein
MNSENYTIVYCEGAFNTPNGKTAHGLVRYSKRYTILSVIDSNYAGKDAGEVLDGIRLNIPVFASLDQAMEHAEEKDLKPSYFVIGLAPDGGRMTPQVKQSVREAIRKNLNIDSGLHDFLVEDKDIVTLAKWHDVQLRDIRMPPDRKDLHFFSGKIEEVKAQKVAVLGTDSAIGKRTSAWILVNSLKNLGAKTELIGTGQTAWMQGAKYGILLDSLVNDFLTGEIEHAVWTAWKETDADVLVIEGQGSLLNPAYPGGYEILAAARPDIIILQHAPARKDYDGFPGYEIQPLERQIQAIEVISDKPVIAITINHENLNQNEILTEIEQIKKTIHLPAFDLLLDGGDDLSQLVLSKLKNNKNKR